jgi:ABC-type sugar transport system ATPase subunit
MLDWALADNLALPSLGARYGLASFGATRILPRPRSSPTWHRRPPDQTVRTLSGGNQQKVSLAKWMIDQRASARHEPTRGVDVRGRRLIHEMLFAFADAGNAFVMYSTDPEELERPVRGSCDPRDEQPRAASTTRCQRLKR